MGVRPGSLAGAVVILNDRFATRCDPSVTRIDPPRLVACLCWLVSTPTEGGSDMGQDRIDDMRIVGDAKLVRDRQE